jgi:hypothetical protein
MAHFPARAPMIARGPRVGAPAHSLLPLFIKCVENKISRKFVSSISHTCGHTGA